MKKFNEGWLPECILSNFKLPIIVNVQRFIRIVKLLNLLKSSEFCHASTGYAEPVCPQHY